MFRFISSTAIIIIITFLTFSTTSIIMATPPQPPTLYHVPGTISSPIVQILHELGAIEANDVQVETLEFSQLKTPEHFARNPMGTSPTFVDTENDFSIWESGAVLTYLLSMLDKEYKYHPNPTQVSPKTLAYFLHLQQYVIATVYPFVASLYIHTLKPKEEQDVEYVQNSTDKFRTLLAPTLVKFLGDGPYFGGDEPSAIDFLVAKPFRNADSLGVLEEFPTLYELYQKIKSKDSFDKSYTATTAQAVVTKPTTTSTTTTPPNIEGRSMVLVPGWFNKASKNLKVED